jgi:hypothetical protein
MKRGHRGRGRLVRLALLTTLALVAASIFGVAHAGAAVKNGKVLILDQTTTPGVIGAQSVEENAVTLDGLTPDVVNAATWGAMTTADFAQYNAIVLGDATCTGLAAAAPAEANRAVWGPAVDGNVIIVGTDPVFHYRFTRADIQQVTINAVNFAADSASAGKTGMYVGLSCYYHGTAPGTPVPLLDPFGSFTATGVGCYNDAHIVATHPALAGLTDAILSNWSCSVHEAFDSFPSTFLPLAIARDPAGGPPFPGSLSFPDGSSGVPYILASGKGLHFISNIELTETTDTNPVGTPHTVTATVKENGSPVAGAVVTFTVISGPNTGVTGTGTTDASGQATFTYTSSLPGTDTIEASYVDSTGKLQRSNDVDKTWTGDLAITATGTSISATEGAPFSGVVASFSDPDASATAAEYTATIDWGDSTTSSGTITASGPGAFNVSGSHTYAEEGTYTITVVINDVDTASNSATALSRATVGDAALSGTCQDSTSLTAFNGVVQTFSDADPNGTVADYSATIDWGDSSSSAGTIAPSGTQFTVSGSHLYFATGSYTITVTTSDVGGSQTTTRCKVLVAAFAGGGSFVIGNLNSAVGTSVTFWGAQWWKLNSLSGGLAPAAFKGFANNPATPSCGSGWSTAPGNSPPPPAGPLPAFMAVIVSSSISQAGSTISGNTPHMVIVQTNPGYDGNPGHAGTGTVVGTLC